MATKQIKVAPERRNVERVWNISDWPALAVKAQSVVVMGSVVHPGHAVEVPKDMLKKAHKLMKDRDAGLICIGAPPAEYLAFKGKKTRLRLPRNAVRGRGPSESVKPAAKVEFKKVETIKLDPPAPRKTRRSGFAELPETDDKE